MNFVNEYGVAYYVDDKQLQNKEMYSVKSFKTSEEANAYIKEQNKKRSSGYIELLLKSDCNYSEVFKVKEKIIIFKK